MKQWFDQGPDAQLTRQMADMITSVVRGTYCSQCKMITSVVKGTYCSQCNKCSHRYIVT